MSNMSEEELFAIAEEIAERVGPELVKKWADAMPQEPGRYSYDDLPGVWTRDEFGVWTDPAGNSKPAKYNYILGFNENAAKWKRLPDAKIKERG